MRRRLGVAALSVPVLVFLLAFPLSLTPQSRRSRVLITQRVNENVLHRLAGNTRPQATAQNDAGPDDEPDDNEVDDADESDGVTLKGDVLPVVSSVAETLAKVVEREWKEYRTTGR